MDWMTGQSGWQLGALVGRKMAARSSSTTGGEGCGAGVCAFGAFSTLILLDLSAAAQGCSSAWWQRWWRPQSAAAARRQPQTKFTTLKYDDIV